MVTSRFDALPRDALVEGVHPARRPVGDGGGEEVVGGGVLHPAVELALVLLRDPAVLGHPLHGLGQVLDLEVVPVEGPTLLQPEVGDWLARLRLARLVPARGSNDGKGGNNGNDGNDGNVKEVGSQGWQDQIQMTEDVGRRYQSSLPLKV